MCLFKKKNIIPCTESVRNRVLNWFTTSSLHDERHAVFVPVTHIKMYQFTHRTILPLGLYIELVLADELILSNVYPIPQSNV